MHRFFVDISQIEGNRIRIVGEDVNHIKNVLRMKPGEEFCVSTGDKEEYRCAIIEYGEKEALAEIRFVQEKDLELPSRIYLYQGLPKGDKMEWIIQKAVELGVHAVTPVAMKRSVVKLDKKKAETKRRRWNSISESAAKQAKRMIIPEVREVVDFQEAVRQAGECDVILMPYELARGMDETKKILSGIKPGQSIAVFIGPEGGFTQEEADRVLSAGGSWLTLGKRILRTETAGMTMLSILMFMLEEA